MATGADRLVAEHRYISLADELKKPGQDGGALVEIRGIEAFA
jgi:hypothetical protein